MMSKGFGSNDIVQKEIKKLNSSNETKGRLISWSPWPTADFQNRYPAFPFVLTILIIVVIKWYISLLK